MLTKNIRNITANKQAMIRIAQAKFHSSKPLNEMVSFINVFH